MEKILTIVIPTYNMEKYLHKCLDSLLIKDERVLNNIQVLVVNDGSKDSSSVIGHEYEKKYPNIFRVIDKENGNYGSCINRGLKEATGKYIKVLDADDYFDTDVFGAFVRCLADINTELVISDYDVVDEGDRITSSFTFGSKMQPNLPLNFSQVINKNNLNIQMHGVCYKKSIFYNIDYHQIEGVSYTDQQWTFYPLTQIKSVYYFPNALYKYLIGREGQTMANLMEVKNIDQLMVVALEMARVFDEEKWDRHIYSPLLENKLKGQLKVIYETEIINKRNAPNIKQFDEKLKKYPKSYELPSSFEYRSLHYVDYVRSHGFKNIPSILIYTYKIYNRILSTCK